MDLDKKKLVSYEGKVNLFKNIKYFFYREILMKFISKDDLEYRFFSQKSNNTLTLKLKQKTPNLCFKGASENLFYAILSFFVAIYGAFAIEKHTDGLLISLGLLIFPLFKYIYKFYALPKAFEYLLYFFLFGMSGYLYFYFLDTYIAFSMATALFCMFFIGNYFEILKNNQILIFEDLKNESVFLLYKLKNEEDYEDD